MSRNQRRLKSEITWDSNIRGILFVQPPQCYITPRETLSHKGICGRVGRALARDALCRGFDPCRRRLQGVALDFGPKQSG